MGNQTIKHDNPFSMIICREDGVLREPEELENWHSLTEAQRAEFYLSGDFIVRPLRLRPLPAGAQECWGVNVRGKYIAQNGKFKFATQEEAVACADGFVAHCREVIAEAEKFNSVQSSQSAPGR